MTWNFYTFNLDIGKAGAVFMILASALLFFIVWRGGR